MCPWTSGFLKTGKVEKPSASETCDCKGSSSESLCHEGEWIGSTFLQLRVCGKNLLLLFRKVLSVLMSKGVLGESLPESLGSSKGETLGFVPIGRGGVLGYRPDAFPCSEDFNVYSRIRNTSNIPSEWKALLLLEQYCPLELPLWSWWCRHSFCMNLPMLYYKPV